MQIAIRSLAERGVGFGTSGVRATVQALTADVCFAYTSAFLQMLEHRDPAWTGRAEPVDKLRAGPVEARTVAIGHDLRPSSPRITAACIAACDAAGVRVIHCGALPTPALAHFALTRGVPAIVVTGSHIPFDRNGIKFYTSAGEILKDDEAVIANATVSFDTLSFDDDGNLTRHLVIPPVDHSATRLYVERYLGFVRPFVLRGRRIGVYEHSSVARDLIVDVLRRLGADIVSLGRTDTFVPVDTEAVSDADQQQARAWAAEHRLDAIVSTDGDADRPLIADDTGEYLRGDVVGILCAHFVGARTVVTPVSSNTAVERCGWFERVIRTRIGSPYVIAAMSSETEAPVVGYEANGGFLLGSGVTRGDARLTALPTRDALLPIVALLTMATERGEPLSALRADLPRRFTASDRIQGFETERSRRLLEHLAAPEALKDFFRELGTPAGVNTVDGVRVTLASGEIVHLRPSGNAPELRCYAEADTPERARELSRWGLAAVSDASPGVVGAASSAPVRSQGEAGAPIVARNGRSKGV